MRFQSELSLLLAWLALSPCAAADDETASDLDGAQRRLQQVEQELDTATDRLLATQARMEQQAIRLAEAGLAGDRGSSSGLGGWWDRLDLGVWLAASYLYNLNDPSDAAHGGLGGTNGGLNGRLLFLHQEHDTFSFDQLWIEAKHVADEEHRAGFLLDFGYGKVGRLLGGRPDRDLVLYSAYVETLAPFGLAGADTRFQLGMFYTHVGAEAAQAFWNYNITRSNQWALLEPSDHTGLKIAGAVGESGFDYMLGVVNGFGRDQPDRNDAKSLVWHLGWTGERLWLSWNGIWGGEQVGFDGAESGISNVILGFSPTERIAGYVSADFAWIDPGSREGTPFAWGVSAVARYGLSDDTGIALRAEVLADHDRFLGMLDSDGETRDFAIWGVTGTVDHLLTDRLKVRGELRYDRARKSGGPDGEFFENSRLTSGLSEDQILIGVEVLFSLAPWES